MAHGHGDYSNLPVTITLTGRAAHHVRRRAEITGMSLEAVTEEAVADEMGRPLYDALYRGRVEHITRLDGLARRLADTALELGGMPRLDAAVVVAAAQDHLGALLEDEARTASLEQLAQLWSHRTTAWGQRPDGSHGPTETTTVEFEVTPQQYDALQRIGHPGGDAGQRIMQYAIPALDPAPGTVFNLLRQRRMTLAVWQQDDGSYSAVCLDLDVRCNRQTAHEAKSAVCETVNDLVHTNPSLLNRWALVEAFTVPAGDANVRLAAVLDQDEHGHWTASEPITGLVAEGATRPGALSALQHVVADHAATHGLPPVDILPMDIDYPQAWLDQQETRLREEMTPQKQGDQDLPERPYPLAGLLMTGRGGRDRQLIQPATERVDSHQGVGLLVGVDADHDHEGASDGECGSVAGSAAGARLNRAESTLLSSHSTGTPGPAGRHIKDKPP